MCQCHAHNRRTIELVIQEKDSAERDIEKREGGVAVRHAHYCPRHFNVARPWQERHSANAMIAKETKLGDRKLLLPHSI